MDITLHFNPTHSNAFVVNLPLSKSQSNRALIINYLSKKSVSFKAISEAKDTSILSNILNQLPEVVDVGPSGTSFRFLVALLCVTPGQRIITGTERLRQRPIGPLVSALCAIGGQIKYLDRIGFAPLAIEGQQSLEGGSLELDSSQSSQFASALLMIGPVCKNGLDLSFSNIPASQDFIELTLKMMDDAGAKVLRQGQRIIVESGNYGPGHLVIEKDWASASYFYALVALSNSNIEIFFPELLPDSNQPDRRTVELFEMLGIETIPASLGILIRRKTKKLPEFFSYDFSNCPDLVMSVAVVLAALNIPAELIGLHTLSLKESDRTKVLAAELSKFGKQVVNTNSSSLLISGIFSCRANVKIQTYLDHRIAMAFAPLVVLTNSITIEDPDVVEKSFPSFWKEMSIFAELIYNA
ncbi:MAG: hypothetical protein U0V49_14850 [Saprospiraceae bacterium]|mgnify:CR=1 FL=1